MNLRPKLSYDGYYRALHNGPWQDYRKETKKQKHEPNATKPTTAIRTELKCLNYLILKSLRGSSRRSPLVQGKFDISAQLRRYLGTRMVCFIATQMQCNFLLIIHFKQTDTSITRTTAQFSTTIFVCAFKKQKNLLIFLQKHLKKNRYFTKMYLIFHLQFLKINVA